jgi:hypothetical protein
MLLRDIISACSVIYKTWTMPQWENGTLQSELHGQNLTACATERHRGALNGLVKEGWILWGYIVIHFRPWFARVLAGLSYIGNTVEFWRRRRYVPTKTHQSLFSYPGRLKFEFFTNKKPEILKRIQDGNDMSFHLLACFKIERNNGI